MLSKNELKERLKMLALKRVVLFRQIRLRRILNRIHAIDTVNWKCCEHECKLA